MSKRRREEAAIELVGSLVLLGVLGWMFSPPFRQLVQNIAVIALFVVLVLAVLIPTYWYTNRRDQTLAFPDNSNQSKPSQSAWPQRSAHQAANTFAEPARTSPLNSPHPNSTENIVRRLRSIDWFQFEKVVAVAYRKLGFNVTRQGGQISMAVLTSSLKRTARRPGGNVSNGRRGMSESGLSESSWGHWPTPVCQRGFHHVKRLRRPCQAIGGQHAIEILNESSSPSLLESVDARYDPEILEFLQNSAKYCSRCERVMLVKTAGKGPHPSSKFWGCSGYPKCRYTMPI
jgi:hypothetical protein